jgi:leader peptidase (prepilin peptidase) / N-methyltransferase
LTSLASKAVESVGVYRPRRLVLDRAIAACFALAVALHLGLDMHGLVLGAVVAILVELAAIDLERRVLPNRIVIPAILLVLGAWFADEPSRYAESLVSAVAAGAVLFLPALVRPGAIGMGDVKLAVLLGAALGYPVTAALVIGLCASGGFALLLVVNRGRSALGQEIPLGPFLAGGAIAAVLLATPSAIS